MLQKYKESAFEVLSLDLSRFSFLKKLFDKKSPYNLKFFVHAYFCFHFCNITNLDNFNIERFFLVIWLFTGFYGFISKFKNKLRLGKYYYNFLVKYFLKKRIFFNILSFLLDDFLQNNYKDGFWLKKNYYFLIFNSLDMLTNLKLAKGVYFYRVKHKLYIYIKMVRSLLKYFLYYLNSLKLYHFLVN